MNDNAQNIRILNFEAHRLVFHFLQNGNEFKLLTLNIGYLSVVADFLMSELPTESEVEYAINCIEDELMSDRQLVSGQEKMIVRSSFVSRVLKTYSLGKQTVSRQEIEDLFSEFARMILRKHTAGSDWPFDKEHFAVILLLREITHHLKFEYIVLED